MTKLCIIKFADDEFCLAVIEPHQIVCHVGFPTDSQTFHPTLESARSFFDTERFGADTEIDFTQYENRPYEIVHTY